MMITAFKECFASFRKSDTGNIAITGAMSLFAVMTAAATGIEMGQAHTTRTKLQAIADSASVAAARELRLGNAKPDIIIGVAQSHAAAGLSGSNISYQFSGSISEDKRTVTVKLSATSSAGLGASVGLVDPVVAVTSSARVMGGAPVCAIGLNPKAPSTIDLEKQARVEAPKCAVYSNSSSPNGIDARDSAILSAAFICSGGGAKGGSATFTPQPATDCPIFPDPLASRPAPKYSGCDATKLHVRISDVDTYLTPGVYCGGLTVDKNVIVTMQPGIYIIKDGPISLQNGARLQGTGVGIYFTGENAALDLRKESSLSLTAPTNGEMAGLLLYQDRATVADNVRFEVSSDDASNLLGTIYLPRGHLYLGGDKPVAQKSAYTIVIANKIQMSAGPTLVLNSNYSASDVPVPAGVGPLSNQVALER